MEDDAVAAPSAGEPRRPGTARERAGAGSVEHTAFHGHPYGLLAGSPAGGVTVFNASAARIVGSGTDLGAGGDGLVCGLIGCRRAGGPLEGLCLHERAAEQAGPLPEVRVDLPDGAGERAAWVTVARVADEPVQILTQLRPGDPNDRRRRTTPHWTTGPRLRIVTLGRTSVQGPEGPIAGRWLANRPGKVLKFLLAHRQRVSFADELSEKLWPESGAGSLEGVRHFVHVLREHLEPGPRERGKSSFVLAEPGGYRIDRANVQIDADEFEDRVNAGQAALQGGDDAAAASALAGALELYGGDFLADEPYAEWALDERDRLHGIATDAMRTLAGVHQRAGDLEAATAALERLTLHEPFDVEAHIDLLRLLVQRGRRSEAVRRYGMLRQRMLTTFGEDVGFTLADVVVPG
jgi:DNA-binding SARP family transcriptional activator